MPANLPPQYMETERKLKDAKTPQEKIEIYEELLAIVPKHKGTEKVQALLKTKIAKLRFFAQKRPAIARHGPSHHIEKSGAGQVVLIGSPNSGKSMLVKSLTGANPEVGEYPYMTRSAAPFMMRFENIQIQLVDTPPVSPDYMETGFPELVKAGDAVLLLADLGSPDVATGLETLILRFKEKKVEFVPENMVIPAERRPFLKKTVVVANKCDLEGAARVFAELKIFFGERFPFIPVSAFRGDGLEDLKRRIFLSLDIIRVYSKTPGKKVELDAPFTLKKGSTVLEMARVIHKDFVEKFKYARLWRKNSLPGQMVNRDHSLQDEDVVEVHI